MTARPSLMRAVSPSPCSRKGCRAAHQQNIRMVARNAVDTTSLRRIFVTARVKTTHVFRTKTLARRYPVSTAAKHARDLSLGQRWSTQTRAAREVAL